MADYTTIAEVRATDGLADETTFPDATVAEAIEWAESVIDEYTKTTWTHKAFTVTVSGMDRASLRLATDDGFPVLYPRTISSVTVDGVAATGFASWVLYPEGLVVRPDGASFPSSYAGRNVVVSGLAGITETVPVDIAWCARTLARQYALDLVSRIPDRALSIQNDFGNVALAQATSHPDRPTSLPEVNARLSRRRQLPASLPF